MSWWAALRKGNHQQHTRGRNDCKSRLTDSSEQEEEEEAEEEEEEEEENEEDDEEAEAEAETEEEGKGEEKSLKCHATSFPLFIHDKRNRILAAD